jgi:hypothetical protein
MKKLEANKLEQLTGGGCMKWIRRARREANRAEGGDPEIYDLLLEAFEDCIAAQY